MNRQVRKYPPFQVLLADYYKKPFAVRRLRATLFPLIESNLQTLVVSFALADIVYTFHLQCQDAN